MKNFRILFLLMFLLPFALCLLPSPSYSSALGDLAVSMQPNTWAELKNTGGFNGGTILTRCVHSMLAFNNECFWDSTTKQLYILGSGHGDWASSNCIGFLRYDEAGNQWTTLPKPPFYAQMHHNWDHTAFDQANRRLYHKTSIGENTFEYIMSTGAWTQIAGPFDQSLDSRYGALEYFPELNSLFWYRVPYLLNLATKQWTAIPHSFQSKTPSGEWTYQEFAEYNPNHKLMLFGGGNGARHLFKMDAAKTVTHLKDSPFGMGINNSIEYTDTRTGKLVVYREDGSNEMWSYDAENDTWAQLSGSAPFLTNYGDWENMVGGWINTYGVGIYLQWNGNNSKIYLYKPPTAQTEDEKAQRPSRERIEISPNPVSGGRATISMGGNYKGANVALYDLRGKRVERLAQNAAGEIPWHSKGIPAGVYVLKMTLGSNSFARKILVE